MLCRYASASLPLTDSHGVNVQYSRQRGLGTKSRFNLVEYVHAENVNIMFGFKSNTMFVWNG